MSSTTTKPDTGDRGTKQLRSLLSDHPLSTYYLLVGSTLLLLGLGLVMVLSASSIESINVFGSAYTLVQRQALFAVGGVALMFVASRMSVEFWRKSAPWILALSFVLLVVVLFVGREVAGQKNWIELFGPFRLQPSEFAKFGLILWGADLLTKRERMMTSWKPLLIPLLPVAGLMMLLVLMEGDFGNTLMLAVILLGMLFAVGAPLRIFAVFAAAGAVGIVFLTLAAPYRMARFTSWLSPEDDRLGTGWQLIQGQYALGTGGWWGVGLGASREKWGSLPEAHTDFIYSVIGEELGLVGTIAVLVLFATLIFATYRVIRNARETFVKVAAAGVGAWVLFQAIVNIGAVLGLLPITGVPLPLVSYGGSSLVPTLAALGMLMGFARVEPAAARALTKRKTVRASRNRT